MADNQGTGWQQNPDDKKKPADAPGHLAMQDITSKYYQGYLKDLKKGGSSGISDFFGSAADIFGEEPDKSESFDPTMWKPENEEEIAKRATYLANNVISSCKEFLDSHLAAWKKGEYDSLPSKKEKPAVSASTQAIVLKAALATILIMLGAENSEAPRWLRSLLFSAIKEGDKLTQSPSIDHILAILVTSEQIELADVCKNGTNSICGAYGFGLVGEPAWTAVHNYFCKVRRDELLFDALTMPIFEIERVMAKSSA